MPATPKRGPLFWILITLGTLMLLGVLAVGSLGFFVTRAMRQSGVSMQDLKKNPQIGVVRIAASMNPNVEIISENEDDNSIVIYDKRKNQTLRMRVNPDTRQLEITDASGAPVPASSTAKAPLPTWIPEYPATTARSLLTAKTADGASSTFTFRTSDPGEQVLDFYEQSLKSGGFATTRVSQTSGGTLLAQAPGLKRSAMVSVASNGDVVIQTIEKQ